MANLKNLFLLIFILFFTFYTYNNYKESLNFQSLSEKYPTLEIPLSYIAAFYYGIKGDNAKANEHYLKILESNGQSKQILDIANMFDNLGNEYFTNGEYKKSLENFEACFNVRKQVLKENDPKMGAVLNRLAKVYKALGETNKAIEFYEKSLRVFEENESESQLYLSNTLKILAELYDTLGDAKEKEKYNNKFYEYEKKRNANQNQREISNNAEL